MGGFTNSIHATRPPQLDSSTTSSCRAISSPSSWNHCASNTQLPVTIAITVTVAYSCSTAIAAAVESEQQYQHAAIQPQQRVADGCPAVQRRGQGGKEAGSHQTGMVSP